MTTIATVTHSETGKIRAVYRTVGHAKNAIRKNWRFFGGGYIVEEYELEQPVAGWVPDGKDGWSEL